MRLPTPQFVLLISCFFAVTLSAAPAGERINVLLAIADDQSYPHASAYGTAWLNTPNFDRLAKTGVLFHNAFAPAPQCSPCRAALLTGRNIWQLKEAGTHGSYFPREFPVFTRRLEQHGYHVGYTGKPWSPGNWRDAGWDRNPVGDEYNERTLDPPTSGITSTDYAGNFETFLQARAPGQPFFFWYGGKEPHRDYEYGSGKEAGKLPSLVAVPPFLPDSDIVRNDVLDYALEIEWFDQHLGRMLRKLEEIGELDRTVVIVTADNGMPFPYAKANLQEFGTRVPLVVSGPDLWAGARETHALTSLIDLAPTILELTGATPLPEVTGRSLLPLLKAGRAHRDSVLTGRERHTHARPDNLGYPARALRTEDFLYVWNVRPERWPAGDPVPEEITSSQAEGSFSADFKSMGLGYADIDDSPSKELLIQEEEAYPDLFFLTMGKRPEEQLYHIQTDPWCLHDLSRNPKYQELLTNMRLRLKAELASQGDPRVVGNGNIFESYPRFGSMRYFPGFKERGAYNPDFADDPSHNER